MATAHPTREGQLPPRVLLIIGRTPRKRSSSTISTPIAAEQQTVLPRNDQIRRPGGCSLRQAKALAS